MSENRDFGFCPRCGALMKDGVCQSCGYVIRQPSAQPNVQRDSGAQNGYYGQPYMQGTPYVQVTERKKGKKGLIIALSVIGMVLLLLIFIVTLVFWSGMIEQAGTDSSYNESYDDYYDDSNDDYYDNYEDYYDDYGGYDSGYYVPDESDPYYREIVDATQTDLEYGVSWIVESVTPDDSEDTCTYYSTYPVLTGDGADYSAINSRITEMALQYRESYTDYPGGATTLGYVTYMDETQISIVFQHSIYEDNGTLPRISSLTFDLETGTEIQPEQMTEINEELVMRFRSQNTTQNGSVSFVDNASDEELLALLQNREESVYFYTPVGLEVGFNYESDDYSSGWVSVTLKDQAL